MAADQTGAQGFTHSVASGEPSATSVLLWTRFVPSVAGAVKLRVEISPRPDFSIIEGYAYVYTGPWRDYCAKTTIQRLRPGSRYYYRFIDPSGKESPTGRTKTLPGDNIERFNIAIFSCAHFSSGHFNAYAHVANRDDIDLVVHLGDYIYEHGPSETMEIDTFVKGRDFSPSKEAFDLQDYRRIYRYYRSDPDLQALHLAHPMIIQWDDHESANNAWTGGAEFHVDARVDWATRKAAAQQAFREWLPVSELPWSHYEIGRLASLFRTDTRLAGRTEQRSISKILASANPGPELEAFKQGDWLDPAQTVLGHEQEAWLAAEIDQSVRTGRRWQIMASGTVVGDVLTPQEHLEWQGPGVSARARLRAQARMKAGQLGLPNNLDGWSGYPAARGRLFQASLSSAANLVVISGDSHNAWAFNLQDAGAAVGVEFSGHSVTSKGLDLEILAPPSDVAAAFVRSSPDLVWCNTRDRGYMTLEIASDRLVNTWWFLDTVRSRAFVAYAGQQAQVRHGHRRLELIGATSEHCGAISGAIPARPRKMARRPDGEACLRGARPLLGGRSPP